MTASTDDIALPPTSPSLAALGRAIGRFSAVHGTIEIFQALAAGLVEDFGVAMAAVWAFDPAANAVILRATAGSPGYRERATTSMPSTDLSSPIVRVAMLREPQVIAAIGPANGFKDLGWLSEMGITAYAGLPLAVDDQGCGAVSLFNREPWTPEVLDALRVLAQHAALAIEHARLLEESATLQGIAAEVAAARNPDDLLQEIVHRTRAALGADGCAVWLVQEHDGSIRPGAADGLSERFLASGSRPDGRPYSAMFNTVAETGMPLFTRDDQAVARERNPRLAQTLADEGIVSALRLPLFAPGRQVVGMLALYHHHERRYTDGDVRLAQAFTDQIAVALHNARLAANEREAQVAARRQLDRLSNLSRVTESLLSSTDIASVQRIAVSAAVALCSAEASALALVKPGQRKLVLSATHGSLEQWFSSFTETNLDEAYTAASITGEAIQTGVTVLASDYLARPVVSAAQVAATAAGIRSMIAAPLRKGDTILGVLWVAHRESGALTQEDALIIDALVEQVALALEQARLLEESHTLQVIAAELASTRETPAMIRAIVERTKSALAADGCALWLIEEEPARLALGAADGLSPWFWERVQQVLTEEAKTAESAHRSVMLMTEPEYSADDQRRARDASEALGEAIRRESVSSALRLPLFESGGTVVGMLALYHHHQRRYSEGELRLAQAFANQIAVALHNARLAEKEQAAQAEARRQLDRLTTITQITEQLLGATELSSVLRIVVESAGRLSGASGAMVGLVDDEGHRLTAVAADGEPKVFFQNFSGPTLDREYLTNTATGQAMTQCAPVVVEDYATWPTPHPVQEETVRSGVRAFVVAPMMVAGKPIGVLWVNDVRPRGFSAEDVTLVQALADQAALAIEHARLVQRGQDAAVLEERTRLARDLHDSVTQSVFSLGMMARAAQTQFARGNDRLGGTLDRIAELSQDALREMRSLLFELQPTGLAEEGLSGALRTLADAVRTRTQIDVTFEGDCSIRLAPEVETAAFRIMQEALANASKHAGATSIALTLEERRDRLVISVRDDGVGFDPAASSAAVADSRLGGMGMRTMQERAAACGLQLRIRSSLGAGTTVTVEAPLPVEMTAAL